MAYSPARATIVDQGMQRCDPCGHGRLGDYLGTLSGVDRATALFLACDPWHVLGSVAALTGRPTHMDVVMCHEHPLALARAGLLLLLASKLDTTSDSDMSLLWEVWYCATWTPGTAERLRPYIQRLAEGKMSFLYTDSVYITALDRSVCDVWSWWLKRLTDDMPTPVTHLNNRHILSDDPSIAHLAHALLNPFTEHNRQRALQQLVEDLSYEVFDIQDVYACGPHKLSDLRQAIRDDLQRWIDTLSLTTTGAAMGNGAGGGDTTESAEGSREANITFLAAGCDTWCWPWDSQFVRHWMPFRVSQLQQEAVRGPGLVARVCVTQMTALVSAFQQRLRGVAEDVGGDGGGLSLHMALFASDPVEFCLAHAKLPAQQQPGSTQPSQPAVQFDIIVTGNVCDDVGLLPLLVAATPRLEQASHARLYTQTRTWGTECQTIDDYLDRSFHNTGFMLPSWLGLRLLTDLEPRATGYLQTCGQQFTEYTRPWTLEWGQADALTGVDQAVLRPEFYAGGDLHGSAHTACDLHGSARTACASVSPAAFNAYESCLQALANACLVPASSGRQGPGRASHNMLAHVLLSLVQRCTVIQEDRGVCTGGWDAVSTLIHVIGGAGRPPCQLVALRMVAWDVLHRQMHPAGDGNPVELMDYHLRRFQGILTLTSAYQRLSLSPTQASVVLVPCPDKTAAQSWRRWFRWLKAGQPAPPGCLLTDTSRLTVTSSGQMHVAFKCWDIVDRPGTHGDIQYLVAVFNPQGRHLLTKPVLLSTLTRPLQDPRTVRHVSRRLQAGSIPWFNRPVPAVLDGLHIAPLVSFTEGYRGYKLVLELHTTSEDIKVLPVPGQQLFSHSVTLQLGTINIPVAFERPVVVDNRQSCISGLPSAQVCPSHADPGVVKIMLWKAPAWASCIGCTSNFTLTSDSLPRTSVMGKQQRALLNKPDTGDSSFLRDLRDLFERMSVNPCASFCVYTSQGEGLLTGPAKASAPPACALWLRSAVDAAGYSFQTTDGVPVLPVLVVDCRSPMYTHHHKTFAQLQMQLSLQYDFQFSAERGADILTRLLYRNSLHVSPELLDKLPPGLVCNDPTRSPLLLTFLTPILAQHPGRSSGRHMLHGLDLPATWTSAARRLKDMVSTKSVPRWSAACSALAAHETETHEPMFTSSAVQARRAVTAGLVGQALDTLGLQQEDLKLFTAYMHQNGAAALTPQRTATDTLARAHIIASTLLVGPGASLATAAWVRILCLAVRSGTSAWASFDHLTTAVCAQCGSETAKQRCGACGRVVYCSRQCQTYHWRDMHKRQCAELNKERLDAGEQSSTTPAAVPSPCSIASAADAGNIQSATQGPLPDNGTSTQSTAQTTLAPASIDGVASVTRPTTPPASTTTTTTSGVTAQLHVQFPEPQAPVILTAAEWAAACREALASNATMRQIAAVVMPEGHVDPECPEMVGLHQLLIAASLLDEDELAPVLTVAQA